MAFWRRRSLRAETRPRIAFGPNPDLWAALVSPTSVSGTPVARLEALSVPAVARGRNLIASIATLPLVELNAERQRVRSPLFDQLDPDVPNVVVLAQTLEDLLFEGVGWWYVTAQDFDDFAVAVRHVPVAAVTVRPTPPSDVLPSGIEPHGVDDTVHVDGIGEVPTSRVIRFDSPNPGILHVGGRPIRRAILLDQVAGLYADNPRPLDYFTDETEEEALDDDEIAELLNNWARYRKEHSTGYIGSGLEYHQVDSPSPSDLQIAQLQQQVTLELANLMGLDPEDLGISTTSRTYQNSIDRRRDRINDVLAPFMRSITDRLSMGDVTRRGHRVIFDLDDYMKANPVERVQFYGAMVELGAMDAAEVRAFEDLPARAQEPPAIG